MNYCILSDNREKPGNDMIYAGGDMSAVETARSGLARMIASGELSAGQLTALVVYVATLDVPMVIAPRDASNRAAY